MNQPLNPQLLKMQTKNENAKHKNDPKHLIQQAYEREHLNDKGILRMIYESVRNHE